MEKQIPTEEAETDADEADMAFFRLHFTRTIKNKERKPVPFPCIKAGIGNEDCHNRPVGVCFCRHHLFFLFFFVPEVFFVFFG